MKKYVLLLWGSLWMTFAAFSQETTTFSKAQIKHNVSLLASDSLQGRKVFTPGIQKAARFIAGKFQSIGLQKWQGQNTYLQKFDLLSVTPQSLQVQWNGEHISNENVLEITTHKTINWSDQDDIGVDTLADKEAFRDKMSSYLHPKKNTLVWVKPTLKNLFFRVKKYFSNQLGFPSSATTLLILADDAPNSFHFRRRSNL